MDENVIFWNLKKVDTGGHLVKAATDYGSLYIQNTPAKPVVIPAA